MHESTIEKDHQTSQLTSIAELPNGPHLDDITHGKLRGYVSQKNHGLLNMDIIKYEEMKNQMNQ